VGVKQRYWCNLRTKRKLLQLFDTKDKMYSFEKCSELYRDYHNPTCERAWNVDCSILSKEKAMSTLIDISRCLRKRKEYRLFCVPEEERDKGHAGAIKRLEKHKAECQAQLRKPTSKLPKRIPPLPLRDIFTISDFITTLAKKEKASLKVTQVQTRERSYVTVLLETSQGFKYIKTGETLIQALQGLVKLLIEIHDWRPTYVRALRRKFKL